MLKNDFLNSSILLLLILSCESCHSSNEYCFENPYYSINRICFLTPSNGGSLELDTFPIIDPGTSSGLYFYDVSNDVIVKLSHGDRNGNCDMLKKEFIENICEDGNDDRKYLKHLYYKEDYFEQIFIENKLFSMHKINKDLSNVTKYVTSRSIYCNEQYTISLILRIPYSDNTDSLVNVLDGYKLTKFNEYDFKY